MAMIPTQSKYPDRAGYLGLDTDRNVLSVMSDGKMKSTSIPEGWINVKDFGAKGDGIHDDTLAIQDAINSAQKTNYDRNHAMATVFIPHGVYLTTNTIELTKNVNFIMDGIILYDGNSTCILLNNSIKRNAILKFKLRKKTYSDWITDDSKAIEISGTNINNIFYHELVDFKYGIYSDSIDTVIGWNNFYSGFNKNLKYLYYFRVQGNGWINENTFWKTFIHIDSNINPGQNHTYFYFDANWISCHGNTMIEPSFEGSRAIGLEVYNGCYDFNIYLARNENMLKTIKSVNSYYINVSVKLGAVSHDISYTSDYNNKKNVPPIFGFIQYHKLFSLSNIKDLRNTNRIYPFCSNYGTNSILSSSQHNLISLYQDSLNVTYDPILLSAGLLIELKNAQFIKIITNGPLYSFGLRFYDESMQLIDNLIIEENVIPMRVYTLMSSNNLYIRPSTNGYREKIIFLNKLSSIKYIFISPFVGNIGSKITYTQFDIYTDSEKAKLVYPDLILPSENILFGSTVDRPTQNYTGQLYYDTDLKKTIVWDGTAWANLDGTAL